MANDNLNGFRNLIRIWKNNRAEHLHKQRKPFMTDDTQELLPAIDTKITDHDDYIQIHKIIQNRGLAATLNLLAEYCNRRTIEAIRKKNPSGKNAWLKRYQRIRVCVAHIETTQRITT